MTVFGEAVASEFAAGFTTSISPVIERKTTRAAGKQVSSELLILGRNQLSK
jgi:hypothetical protein